jgi:4-alpha-glucanotransferase
VSDEALRGLATKAGITTEWQDQKGLMHAVAPGTLRALLGILGLPCQTAGELRDSLVRLEAAEHEAPSAFLTTRLGQALPLPGGGGGEHAKIRFEDGSQQDLRLEEGQAGRALLPGLDRAGYHRVEFDGRELTVAAAPLRAFGVEDAAPGERIFGLAAQIYSLRRAGDGGTGDLAGAAALAAAAGRHGADALTLSPLHALFTADPARFSPYSPSSRLFYNPLHAAPAMVLGDERLRQVMAESGLQDEFARLEGLELIDWPMAGNAKMALFRKLFEDFERHAL